MKLRKQKKVEDSRSSKVRTVFMNSTDTSITQRCHSTNMRISEKSSQVSLLPPLRAGRPCMRASRAQCTADTLVPPQPDRLVRPRSSREERDSCTVGGSAVLSENI